MQKTDLLNLSEKMQDKVSRLSGCVAWKADSCAEKEVRTESAGTIDLKDETYLLTREAEPSLESLAAFTSLLRLFSREETGSRSLACYPTVFDFS